MTKQSKRISRKGIKWNRTRFSIPAKRRISESISSAIIEKIMAGEKANKNESWQGIGEIK